MDDQEYNDSPELKDLAQHLISRYSLHLGHVDVENIFFAEINGEKPKKGKVARLAGASSKWVRQILAKNNEAMYCLAVYGDTWTKLTPSQQQWIMFDLLLSIAPENDGKVNKPDCVEWGILVEYQGAWWRKKDSLPDMLNGLDPLPIPLPPMEEDEGATVVF